MSPRAGADFGERYRLIADEIGEPQVSGDVDRLRDLISVDQSQEGGRRSVGRLAHEDSPLLVAALAGARFAER
jgi:hypothetical protein